MTGSVLNLAILGATILIMLFVIFDRRIIRFWQSRQLRAKTGELNEGQKARECARRMIVRLDIESIYDYADLIVRLHSIRREVFKEATLCVDIQYQILGDPHVVSTTIRKPGEKPRVILAYAVPPDKIIPIISL